MSIKKKLTLILRRLIYVVSCLVILFAILVAVARAFTPILNQHRTELTDFISKNIQAPVQIAQVSGTWHWLQPTIKLKQVKLLEPASKSVAMEIKEIDVGINLFKSLRYWSLRPGDIVINGTSLSFIENNKGHWSLQGLSSSNTEKNTNSLQFNTLSQLLNGSRIKLQDVSIILHQRHHKAVTLSVSNLKLRVTDQELSLYSQKASLSFPDMFREKLTISQIDTTLLWEHQTRGWMFEAPAIYVETPESVIHAKLSFLSPDNAQESSVIDLTADVAISQLDQQGINKYLPVGVLSTTVTEWLDTNVLKLGKTQASLILRGPVNDYPFEDKKTGEFSIKSQFSDTDMQISEGWPVATGLQGTMLFAGRSMDIQAKGGTVVGLKVQQARAQIPYMGDEKPTVLTVTAKAEGDAEAALKFLHASPLKTYLQQGLETAQMQGPITTALSLSIPLAQADDQEPVVQGTVNLQQVDANFPAWNVHIKHLQGPLQFSEKGLSSPSMTGQFLGTPLTLSIAAPNQKNKNSTVIALSTTADLAVLESQYHLPLSAIAQGKTLVHGEITIADNKTVQATLNSDLKGVQLKLPQPFNKAAEAKTELNIKAMMMPKQPTQLSFDYDKQAAGIFNFNDTAKGMTFAAGNLILGGDKPGVIAQTGLKVIGNLPVCSVPVWTSALAQVKSLAAKNAQPATTWPSWLNSIMLNCAQLEIGGQNWTNVTVSIADTTSATAITLQSSAAQGTLTLPHNLQNNPLQVQFDRLYLNASASSAISALNTAQLPQIKFAINDLRFVERRFGIVKGSFTPQGQSATFNVSINQDQTTNAQLNGVWTFKPSATDLTGMINSTDTSSTMKNLGLSSNLKSKNAQIKLILNWAGAPYQFSSSKLNGSVNLDIKDGMIVGLDKSTDAMVGFGRVLNLLSLQNLPGRISNTFSNAKERGFPFDTISGKFAIQQGNANTSNAFIKSSVAYITFSGSIGLATQTYNLKMIVIPHLTSSLPAVATIAGGPIVGAAVWVVNKAVSPAVDRIARYQYQITGSWKNPQVQKM